MVKVGCLRLSKILKPGRHGLCIWKRTDAEDDTNEVSSVPVRKRCGRMWQG